MRFRDLGDNPRDWYHVTLMGSPALSRGCGCVECAEWTTGLARSPVCKSNGKLAAEAFLGRAAGAGSHGASHRQARQTDR